MFTFVGGKKTFKFFFRRFQNSKYKYTTEILTSKFNFKMSFVENNSLIDFNPSLLELNENQREQLISQILENGEIDPYEENFWNSNYTESAVSYPSEHSSTEENVDRIIEIFEETTSNSNQLLTHNMLSYNENVDPVLENFAYTSNEINWGNVMPPPVTPIFISAINEN